ncbi:MAG: sigma 54-interacting transcriptional regulator [Proteobacteria bacterium]|nr:sigma 54-interacting transcriptional regulator [Pseudomonadota bacterium]MBU1717123.1 sigma 54-interacting transcriptional regulator [Pseudomonadota bacterium]
MIDINTSENRILIVDDEESLRLTFKMFLTKEGYGPVDAAATFEEAIALIDQHIYDLIISDIVLEGNSGIDLLRYLKESGADCPVVMVTGYPNIESASEAVRLGAFDYLSKPVKKEGLLRVSRMALQQYALWKEKEKLQEDKERYRQYLETIFRSVRDAIITVDSQLRIVEMNDTALSWTKDMPEVAIGAHISSIPGACGKICAKDAEKVITEKVEVHEHRIECEIDNSKSRVLQINAAPLENKSGEFHGVVLLLRDMTQVENMQQRGKRTTFHRLIGVSRPMQTVYTLIENVGQVDTSVLITGESGTGKELVAEALHIESPRHDMPLIKVDCTAIPENLLESELFGHMKGSFTGADRDRQGRIIQADGGTLFLDEIGDISQLMQLRLLRFLQERTFYPVGRDKPVTVDVRVIAATNANLKQKVEEGIFREDLYFRLRVIDIPLPPLRDRNGDLPLLANHFISRFSKRIGHTITGISDQATELLCSFSWPGNVRELEHVIERACVLCKGPTITSEHLPAEIFNHKPGLPVRNTYMSQTKQESQPPISSASFPEQTEPENERIVRVLRQTAGNKAMAARILGFDRSTLYRKMRSYNIDILPTP